MRADHLAIDGSNVTVEADADLSHPATATGWAIVPSIMRAYPFTVYPAGHSSKLKELTEQAEGQVKVLSEKQFGLQDRELQVVEVEMEASAGGRRQLTIGAWEGRGGCLCSSLSGRASDRVVPMFETLKFSDARRGISIDSPVTVDTRVPQVLKYVPELGALSVKPAIDRALETVPRGRGFATRHGEVFRFGAEERSLLFVGKSVVASMRPDDKVDERKMLSVVEDLRMEWKTRPRRG